MKMNLRWLPFLILIGALAASETSNTTSAAESFRDCSECPEMVVIPSGNFQMGSPKTEVGRVRNDESPVHNVSIRTFAIGKFEVTKAQFALFSNESSFSHPKSTFRDSNTFEQEDDHPAINVTWDAAHDFAKWLSQKTGKHYRLPSEAEWEYAARAGTTAARYWGENTDDMCLYANVFDETADANIPRAKGLRYIRTDLRCSDGYAYTAPVGSFKPNQFGLYDMLGNAQEWVADCLHKPTALRDLTLQSDTRGIFYAFTDYFDAPSDGAVWDGGDCGSHMVRGGSWRYTPDDARAASRSWGVNNERDSSRGFRIVRDVN